MDIKYFGHSSFQLKGKDATVITDPFNSEMVGLSFVKTEADLVTISHHHSDHDDLSKISGNPLVIDLAGEYEKKAVRVTGFDVYHDNQEGKERGKNIIYKIEIDDLSVLHCGDLGHTLSDEILEEIGEVDILLVPVGGHFTIGADDAVTVIKKVEPRVVIPMHYGRPELKAETFANLSPVSEFLTKLGISQPVEEQKKVTFKKETVPEEMQVIVMSIA